MLLILGIIGLFAPRLVIFLLWFFSNWFEGIFNGILIPILGFIFLPFTLLWYSAVVNWYGGEWNWFTTIVMIIAVVADLSSGRSAAK